MTNQLTKDPTQTIDRRTFLKRAGGTALVLVAGGSVWRAIRPLAQIAEGRLDGTWNTRKQEAGND